MLTILAATIIKKVGWDLQIPAHFPLTLGEGALTDCISELRGSLVYSHQSRSDFPRKIVLLRKKFHFYSVLFLGDFEGDSNVQYGVGKVFCCALDLD